MMQNKQWIPLSTKNLEHLVLHSLQPEDFALTVDSSLFDELAEQMQQHDEQVMIVSPKEYDKLFKLLEQYATIRGLNSVEKSKTLKDRARYEFP